MWTGNSDDCRFEWNLSGMLRLFHGFLNGLHGLLEIDDHAFARSARVGDAMSSILQSLVRDLDCERDCLCASCVDDRDDVFVPLTHGSLIDSLSVSTMTRRWFVFSEWSRRTLFRYRQLYWRGLGN